MVEKSVINKLKKFSSTLSKAGITIDKMILYGSYAKGLQGRESDIDVAVVSRNFGKDRVEEGMFLFKLAGEVDARIEPVPISVDSFEKDTWIPLIYEIRKNGIEILLSKEEKLR